MNRTILDWFTARANLKNLVLSLMVVIPFNTIIFPLLTGRIRDLSGGVAPLDVTLGYLPQAVMQMIAAYTPQGRSTYLVTQWTADLLFPVAYTLFFSLLLAWIYIPAFQKDSPFQNLRWAPIAMMFFDYLENISISILLVIYPEFPIPLAVMASAASLLKWVLVFTSGISILVGLIALVLKLRKPST